MAIDGNRQQSTAIEPTAIDGCRRLSVTLKAWPVIAAATIGLCFLTQAVAKLFGVDLPDQANIALVKRCFEQAFTSARAFGIAAFLAAQVLVIMPVIEEFLFRWLPFRLPVKFPILLLASSLLFSAAHYIFQPWPDAAFVALFFFGCAQCWLYRKTERIWCAMVNHGLFNLTNLVLLFCL